MCGKAALRNAEAILSAVQESAEGIVGWLAPVEGPNDERRGNRDEEQRESI